MRFPTTVGELWPRPRRGARQTTFSVSLHFTGNCWPAAAWPSPVGPREEKTATSAETKLDHLFADGASEFVERKPSRTVRGGAERPEYWLQEERLVLTRGAPYLIDSQRGSSRGARIEYWQREDRLKVDNTGSGPAVSRITTK